MPKKMKADDERAAHDRRTAALLKVRRASAYHVSLESTTEQRTQAACLHVLNLSPP